MAATRFGSPPGPHGWTGTLAERADLEVGPTDAGALYLFTDKLGRVDKCDGENWITIYDEGGGFIVSPGATPQHNTDDFNTLVAAGSISADYVFKNTTTGQLERWDGYNRWPLYDAGAVITTSPRQRAKIYESGGYTYMCKARHGKALSDAAWCITRINDATGDVDYAGFAYDVAATDEATVVAHTYNEGATP